MSKFKDTKFKVSAYPTFRLYTEPKKFIEFKEKELTEKSMRKWLVDQKVEGFTEKEDKSKLPVASIDPIGPTPLPAQPVNDKERNKAGKSILKG